MGGRGADSGLKPSGSSGNKNIPWSGNVGQNIGTLKEQIRERRKTGYSINHALKTVNPYYNSNFREYSENCQRCVVAYELQRRGYDVQALPTYEGDTEGVVMNVRSGNYRAMGAFQHAKTVDVSGKNSAAVQDNIRSQMQAWGNGSRAIVVIKGHVFNAENMNGRIQYVDAQVGIRYTDKDTFSRINTRNIKIARIDHLRISDRAKNMVEKRRK